MSRGLGDVYKRQISDKADNSAVMDYPEFEKRAIRQNVRLVTELVAEI